MLLNKIAEQLHVHLIGNGGIAVSGITYADVATEDQIAISMSRSEAMREDAMRKVQMYSFALVDTGRIL